MPCVPSSLAIDSPDDPRSRNLLLLQPGDIGIRQKHFESFGELTLVSSISFTFQLSVAPVVPWDNREVTGTRSRIGNSTGFCVEDAFNR